MNEQAILPTKSQPDMGRIAWSIIWAAFATLCALVLLTGLAIYQFFFESAIPIETLIEVGRGTAVIVDANQGERAIRGQNSLTSRSVNVSTDSQSQVTLSFFDSSKAQDQAFLAALTLASGSELRLKEASMPRFEWGRGRITIIIGAFQGKADLLLTGDSQLPAQVSFATRDGAQIQINMAGRYTIDVTDVRVRVTVTEGEAILYGVGQRANRLIPRGQEGILYANRNEPTVTTAKTNLLENGLFALSTPIDTSAEPSQMLPGRWGCSSIQDSPPRGAFTVDTWAGRASMRFLRREEASNHGETRCRQPFGAEGIDISEYTYLELETTFLINYQSLSECGERGSECPLMVHILYDDVDGVAREWFQGFYYLADSQLTYPLRCASCLQDHQQINEKAWYTYETGNLLTSIALDAKPARIRAIELYASGHQYDIFVSEVALFAGYAEVVPPEVVPANG